MPKAKLAQHMALRVLVGLLKGYRLLISPVLGALGVHCRFHPSCSQYALDALRAYGLRRGLCKTLCRLAKCHPFHPGGYDPA